MSGELSQLKRYLHETLGAEVSHLLRSTTAGSVLPADAGP
jgi:hypothetical protein